MDQKPQDVDKLSELPDDILLHIMNFMDTKDAVKTCVLSKRFKDLYKYLTNLKFKCCHKYRDCPRTFEKFMSWVLINQENSCSLHNLVIDSSVNLAVVDRVTNNNLLRGVQQLEIGLDSCTTETFESFPLIFSFHTLTSLKLYNMFVPRRILPKSLDMPALKSLHLTGFGFRASAEPFSNCHVLNTLVLVRCFLHHDAWVLSIRNSCLSSLTIATLYGRPGMKIVLATPNLVSCTINGLSCHQFPFACNFPFLQEVNIVNSYPYLESSFVIRWLQVFANVKILTLSPYIVGLIHSDLSNPSLMGPKPPCFIRLETLKVKSLIGTSISAEKVTRAVDYLLQNSPIAKVEIIM